MLEELSISHYAIINDTTISFGPGLNILTGPTGSGKTLILDALRLCLGERADYDVLQDHDDAQIRAIFHVDASQQEVFEDDEVFLSRRLTQDRRSPAYYNDDRIRLKKLREYRKRLIDFHGQHQNQVVFEEDYARSILDEYGQYDDLLRNYRELHSEYRSFQGELDELESKNDVDQKIDFLEHQVSELEQFEPSEGEWDEIEDRRRTLEDSEEIQKALKTIVSIMDEENGPESQIATIVRNLKTVKEAAGGLDQWVDELRDVKTILNEFLQRIKEIQSELNLSADDFDELMDRRGRWMELSRKHNVPPESLFDQYKDLQEQLETLRNLNARKTELQQEIEDCEAKLTDLADQLHEQRVNVADTLEGKINERLKRLNLEQARFRIDVKTGNLGPHGYDDVRWLFSSHPSQEPGPLEKRISGGEISRVLLALKSTIAEADKTPVLVFDEIDTGISGEEADRVGRELSRLANHHQIICVTHLPLVAAHADEHIHVGRDDTEDYPDVAVEKIKDTERVNEISRLLSGNRESEVSREQAKELIQDRN